MHEKIQEERITQKNQRMRNPVAIARELVSPTASAHTVDFMQEKPLNVRKPSNPCATPYRIGVDLLGSELPPASILEAVLSYSQECRNKASFIVFGKRDPSFSHAAEQGNVVYVEVEDSIEMDESPLKAVRAKPFSSVCTGISQLKAGQIDAFISSGNTGALLASATLELNTLPLVTRPALITELPTPSGLLAVLDIGATIKADAKHFLELTIMGVAYQKSHHIPFPRVGLLNIGTEAQKGTPQLQEAYKQIKDLADNSASFAFVGNIEGRDAFSGSVDVLVTDGFTGNIFLKTAEGIATAILEQLEPSLSSEKILHELRAKLHYTEHPGAMLCGLESLVIKCHGSSSPSSITHSIKSAIECLDTHFLEQFKEHLFSWSKKIKTFTMKGQ